MYWGSLLCIRRDCSELLVVIYDHDWEFLLAVHDGNASQIAQELCRLSRDDINTTFTTGKGKAEVGRQVIEPDLPYFNSISVRGSMR